MEGHQATMHHKALTAGHILENGVVQGRGGHDNVPRSGPSNQSIREPASPFLSTPSGRSSPLASRGNDSECREITLDVSANSVMPVSGNDSAGTLQERMMGKQLSSFGHAVIPNLPSQIAPVGASPSVGKDHRKLVAAHAITEFKFVSSSDDDVKRRFDYHAVDGVLHRSSFGKCIGMKEGEFAVNLFDTLARRRNICSECIDKAQLLEFWDQISNDSLQTFIDMMDKDGDGRITMEELREIIAVSSSANKLYRVGKKAEEYARLIMEELDPDNLGYIEPYMLKLLLDGSVSASHMGTWGMSAPRASRDNHHGTTEVANDSATMIVGTREHAIIRNAASQVEQVWQEFRRLGAISNHLGNSEHIDRSKLGTAHALKALQSMSRTTRPVVEKLFNELSPNGLLHRSKFGLCIGVKEQDYADNLFDALARRCNIGADYINKAELLELWDQISDQRFDSRLQIFIDMMENSPDGRITEDEVKEIVILSSLGKELSGIQKNIEQEAHGNEMSEIPNNPEEYARVIMEELDPNNLGYIKPYDLQMKMMQAQGQSVGIGTANNGDVGQMNRRLLQTVDRRWYKRAQYFLQDNWKGIRVMLLWLCICVGLFSWKFTQYRRRRAVFRVMGYCICVAKGGAETLKFNMALILLPVCRNTITWLRSRTKIGNAVPLDDSIIFHKMIAVGIIIGSGLHVIPYMTCGFPRLLHLTDEDYKPMKIFGEKRPANYLWFLMGTEGWTGIILLVLMAVAFMLATDWVRQARYRPLWLLRRLGGYDTFWYSHHLFVIVYALLIVHGNCLHLTRKWYNKTTWFYLLVPMFLYACERFARALRSRMRPAKILKVTIFPGNVIRLQFTKSLGFKYKSGQYIYVNCAAVSSFQWHPFYVTSAPIDDYISIHIRTLGDWTTRLKIIFSEVCRPPKEGESGLLRAEYDSDGSLSNPRFPKVLIDGPYSAPAQDYERYDIVLLIGLGIGFTPFISIMKDISNNSKHLDDIESGAVGRAAKSSFRTRRAYIHWISREEGSWEWFNSVMEEAVETDKKGVIELHTYCTSVYAEGDARSALIATLNALSHAKDGVDVVSGSRVKTHFYRPNFRNVYRRIALNHRNQRVGVFYSGAPVLTTMLRELAEDFSRKTSTKFEFHSELY